MTARRLINPLLLILALLVIIGIGLVLFFFLTGRQGQRTLPSLGPTILITSPTPSDAVKPSASILVEATVYGENPIHHIELWMDGEIKQTFYNQQVESPAPVDISFTPLLTVGDHILFVRAIDTHSLIGQSLPIMALGDGSIVGEGPFEMVSISPGDSLEETVASHDADLSTVLAANPNISVGGVHPGTIIAIPRPENTPAQNPPAVTPPGNANFLEITQILPVNPLPLQMIPMQALGPPSAPNGFMAEVNGCDLTFSWTDTSEDEVGFNIWMTGLGVAPHIAARTQDHAQTGTVTTVLSASRSGSFVYWVEAANVFGAQPSNQVKVTINAPCPNNTTETLAIEVLDFSSPGPYDRAYCYISVENTPEVRMPVAKDQFISIVSGKADMAKWPLASRSFQVVPPADQELNLQGECWGWAAGALSKLGTFNSSHPQAQWDGTRQTIADTNFEIGLSLSLSANNKMVLYSAPDPGIPRPYSLEIANAPANLAASQIADPSQSERKLRWKWDGDPSKIDGFTVMVGDIPFKQINDSNVREADIRIPGICDTRLFVTVVANIGEKHSLPSNRVIAPARDCLFYAKVTFDSIYFSWTHDSLEMVVKDQRNCDSFELWFELSVTEFFTQGDPPNMSRTPGRKFVKYFGDSDHYTELGCWTTRFNDIASLINNSYGSSSSSVQTSIQSSSSVKTALNEFIFPIHGAIDQGRFYLMEARLYDYDPYSSNDTVAVHQQGFRLPPLELNSIRNSLGDGNVVKNYDCSPQGYYTHTDSGSSTLVDLCVDFYRQHPGSGGPSVPAYVGGQATPTPTPGRGTDITERADLEALAFYVGIDNQLHLRLQNLGQDDLLNHVISIRMNGSSTHPNFVSSSILETRHIISLAKGAITELPLGNKFELDTNKYDYDLTVEIVPNSSQMSGLERFHDDNTANNIIKYTSQAGQLQAQPDPLLVDLTITGISIEPGWVSNQQVLNVTVKNLGPHTLTDVLVKVECEVDEVQRLGGSNNQYKLSTNRVLTLGVNGVRSFNSFGGYDASGKYAGWFYDLVNLSVNWYRASCGIVSSEGYSDLDLLNNFQIEIIQ